MDPLQIALVIGLILMAAINVASLFWGNYLDRKTKQQPSPKIYEVHADPEKILNEVDFKQIEKEANEVLRESIHKAATQLKEDTEANAARLGTRIDDMVNTNLTQEFEQYQVSLQALRDQTIQQFSKMQTGLDSQRDKLLAELEDDIKREHERRIEQFNARLNDVVSSYLIESLGNQVDLGAQTAYILQSLQQHKEDIKRDMLA